MTGRERILSVLQGQIPDRVPIGIFIQEEFLAYYFPNKTKVDRVIDGVACAKELGFDIMTRGLEFSIPYFLKKNYPNWELASHTKIDGGILYRTMTITTPGGVLTQTEAAPYDEKTISGIHFATTEYLIKDEKDFELFDRYVPEIDADSIQEMRQQAEFAKKTIGQLGISAPWGWGGVYNMATTYRDVQQLLIDPYLNEGFYQAYMGKLTELIVKNYQCLADTAFDCLGLQGNIANGGMVGADYFNQYILTYEKQVISAIKQAGKYALYHNCGRAKNLQESYVAMGTDIWETVAEPPQGDNNLAEAKKLVGDKLVLAGNLDQVHFLKTASPAEVEKEVTRIINEGKPGGKYIFAASDYLEKDTPLENIRTMIATAKKEGRY